MGRWAIPAVTGAVVTALLAHLGYGHAQPRHAAPSCDEQVVTLRSLVGDLRAQRNDQEYIAHGWKARADALQAAVDKAKAPKPEEPLP